MLYSLEEMQACTQCGLHETRTRVVVGRGDPTATLWFAGEAPGREEDETGLAFVGRAGRLLDRCLEKVGIRHFNIVNVLKCRPPGNADPLAHQFSVCSTRWLVPQILEHRPLCIVAMGRFSIGFFRQYDWKTILAMKVGKEIREPFKTKGGRIVIPTYHPAYLVRNADAVQGFLQQLQSAKTLHATLRKQRTRR